MATQPEKCSFCEKQREQVLQLVAAPDGTAICDACIALSVDIVGAPSPVVSFEDRVRTELVGQPTAAAHLGVALRRIRDLPKGARGPVLLLVGPPGTGKSHAADLLARTCGLPAHHAHYSRLSALGYVGEQIGNLLSDL